PIFYKSSGGRIPSSAATLAALRPLARHNSNASCSYSSVYLALLRAGFDNCVFMWASFRVLTLSPLSVKSMQPYPIGFLEVPHEMANTGYPNARSNFFDAEKRGFEKMLRSLQSQLSQVLRKRGIGFSFEQPTQ